MAAVSGGTVTITLTIAELRILRDAVSGHTDYLKDLAADAKAGHEVGYNEDIVADVELAHALNNVLVAEVRRLLGKGK